MNPSINPSASDQRFDGERFMREALQLAKLGEGSAEPNPMVGCLLVSDGQIIGKGYHRKYGGPHAEVEALQSLEDISMARGTTAYVTLEPCCHHGKTPPCADALIDAGVARVVIAMQDPSPKVDGGGLKRLRDAGIETSVGLLQAEAEQLCAPYLKRTRSGLPWVIAKWAMSVDGRIATSGGESQWISCEKSRQEVHRLRGRVDAITVGMGTVEADDPMLTSRLTGVSPQRVALRVVFCLHRLPASETRLIKSAKVVPVILVVGRSVDRQILADLQTAGCQVIEVGATGETEMVTAGLKALAEQGCTNVMLEGGSTLLGSFLSADQIDECHVFVGPKILGGLTAPGPIGGVGIASIAATKQMTLLSLDRLDDDIHAVYRRMP